MYELSNRKFRWRNIFLNNKILFIANDYQILKFTFENFQEEVVSSVIWEVPNDETSNYTFYKMKYIKTHQRIYWKYKGIRNNKCFLYNKDLEDNSEVICKTQFSFDFDDFQICKKDPSIAFIRSKNRGTIFKISLNMSGDKKPMQAYLDEYFKYRHKNPKQETSDYVLIEPIIEVSEGIYWFSVDEESENLYYFNENYTIVKFNLSDKKVLINFDVGYYSKHLIQFKNFVIR
jgi:hypothetical protein